MKANDKQVGGEHYKGSIEPWDAITEWGLGYLDGSAVKYLARWQKKGGIQDVMKAIHFLEKLIEVENERLRRASDTNVPNQQTIADIIAESENRYGARIVDDVAYREQVIAALHRRAKEGYGQPQGRIWTAARHWGYNVKPKPHLVLEMCIKNGIDYGFVRAHKHFAHPPENIIKEEIENAISHEIWEWFSMEEEE